MFPSFFIIEKNEKLVQTLTHFMTRTSHYKYMGSSYCMEDAMNSILKHEVSLVFINVELEFEPGVDSFYLVQELRSLMHQPPLFIAISDNTNKAYRALKQKFYDYLLYPFKEFDLRKLVVQLRHKQQPLFEDTICLKSYKDYILIQPQEILYLKADNNTTEFILLDGQIIHAYKTLKFFEKRLPKQAFVRIHHSYIVNKSHLSRINFGKQICFINHNKLSLPFSKSYRNNLEALEELLDQKAFVG